jgi:hypothetical protein
MTSSLPAALDDVAPAATTRPAVVRGSTGLGTAAARLTLGLASTRHENRPPSGPRFERQSTGPATCMGMDDVQTLKL